MITATIVIASVLFVEMLARLLFPKPLRKLEPQVRLKMDGRMGYRNLPNQKAFSMEKVATINSLGFRGVEISAEREPNSLRILGIGNSLTFGGGIGDDETYLAYLNQQLNKKFPDRLNEVLNSGIYGFTIRQFIPLLEVMLPKLQPEIVLLGTHWRDLHFHPRFGQVKKTADQETWQMMKKKFRESIVKNNCPDTKKDIFIREVKNVMTRFRALYMAKYYTQALKNKLVTPNYQTWQSAFLSGEDNEGIQQRRLEAKKTLSEIMQLCREGNAKFGLLIFPDNQQVKKSFPNSSWPKLLVEICEEINLPYLNLLEPIKAAYRKHGRNFLLPYDVEHYSKETHKEMAVALSEFLEKERFLDVHQTSEIKVLKRNVVTS